MIMPRPKRPSAAAAGSGTVEAGLAGGSPGVASAAGTTGKGGEAGSSANAVWETAAVRKMTASAWES